MKEASQENRWVCAAQKGDQAAFEALVRLYEKRVYGLAFQLCGNSEDAAEAAQEAFFSAWQGLPAFRQESSFSSWLYRMTRNACIDLLRREQRHRRAAGPSLNDEALPLDLPDSRPLPQEELERRELRETLEQGLRALPTEQREVLILREMQQLSYEEISQTLELDLGTVKSRIFRGRRQLRDFLRGTGNFFAPAASKETEKEGCK